MSLTEINAIYDKREKMEKRKQGLLDMRADGEITSEEYTARRNEYEIEIDKLTGSIAKAETSRLSSADYHKKISGMKEALEKILDLSGPTLNREVVDGFIWKIVHVSDNEFDIYLRMGQENGGDCPKTADMR